MVKEPSFANLEEDFEVFNQPNPAESPETNSRPQAVVQANANQGIINILEGMVIQNKTPNLLALLESHARDATPKVSIDLRPSTPIPTQSSPIEPSEKKRKKEKRPSKGVSKEGEIQIQTKSTKAQQKKNDIEGTSFEVVTKCRPTVPTYYPTLILDGALLPSNSSIKYFHQGQAGYVADSVEQVLLVNKHEVFLSLKKGPSLSKSLNS